MMEHLTLMSMSSKGLLSEYEIVLALIPSLAYSSCQYHNGRHDNQNFPFIVSADLFPSKDVLVEVELQLLICHVDTQLLK